MALHLRWVRAGRAIVALSTCVLFAGGCGSHSTADTSLPGAESTESPQLQPAPDTSPSASCSAPGELGLDYEPGECADRGRLPYKFDGRGADVDAKRFGKKLWPLTLQEGRVNCVQTVDGLAVIFTSDSRRYYWLNETARKAAGALEARSPMGIELPRHTAGLQVLRHVCDPLDG